MKSFFLQFLIWFLCNFTKARVAKSDEEAEKIGTWWGHRGPQRRFLCCHSFRFWADYHLCSLDHRRKPSPLVSPIYANQIPPQSKIKTQKKKFKNILISNCNSEIDFFFLKFLMNPTYCSVRPWNRSGLGF